MPASSRVNYRRRQRLVAAARSLGWLAILLASSSGCGMFGGAAQLKQLQAENDKLVTEYRAQRDKVAKLQETNLALEQRVAEAEKLLARSGHNQPSSRLSQVPGRSPSSGVASSGTTPPYVPPTPASGSADTEPQWRPMRRQ